MRSSTIGGYVYRGNALPALRAAYLYGEYESAVFFALRTQGGVSADRSISPPT